MIAPPTPPHIGTVDWGVMVGDTTKVEIYGLDCSPTPDNPAFKQLYALAHEGQWLCIDHMAECATHVPYRAATTYQQVHRAQQIAKAIAWGDYPLLSNPKDAVEPPATTTIPDTYGVF